MNDAKVPSDPATPVRGVRAFVSDRSGDFF